MNHAAASNASHPWYEHAVVYELDVKNVQDSDGDGVGDFRGLIARLDYIASLGVDCVWLQPFYVTPNRDNGYDIADYERVDPRLGTLDDFDAFVRAAAERRLRVIADLPLNHVSEQHPWFQDARASRGSAYRDWFIWSDEKPENHDPYPVFGPEQGGNWKWDEQAKQFYFHTFYRFMPDLNMDNCDVQAALLDVAQFWMRRGLSGFRLDAVPFLIHHTSEKEKLEQPHAFLKKLHAAVERVCPDAMLMAEANLKPHEMRPYFGDGDEMHLLLNFYLCNHLFLALADGRAEHIERSWNELPAIPDRCQWANFLRNHDELSLDQLADDERQRCFDAFGPEAAMQLYGRGIRRRLAPMLDGDLRRQKLMMSLLFSLPGTPALNAGEEIGLGDDLRLKDREAARTPMQWDASPNAGFSSAPCDKLIRPVVDFGPFAYRHLNVAQQERDPASLLAFTRRAIGAYKSCPALAVGEWSFEKSDRPGVLIYRSEHQGRRAYTLHNLRGEPVAVSADLPGDLREVMSDRAYPKAEAKQVQLGAYGFRWLAEEVPR